MTVFEYYTRQVPTYYKGMYRDGYSPEETLHALRNQMLQSHYNREDEAEQNEVMNVKITSEVRIK